MLRFILFVVGGIVGASLLWSLLPVGTAFAINWLLPFGFERFANTSALRHFQLTCIVAIAPIAVLSVIRTARRMHFNATDGRPALLGNAGSGANAARAYARRAKLALFVAAAAILSALASAAFTARNPSQATFPAFTAYSCLVFVFCLVAAIEFNDLRRTANLGGLQSDA